MLTEQEKQSKFSNMFFMLKIMALFFCTAPLFQYYFGDSTSHMLPNLNLGMGIIFLSIIAYTLFGKVNSAGIEINPVHYQDILKSVLAEKGLIAGRILKSPMETLFDYHVQRDL